MRLCDPAGLITHLLCPPLPHTHTHTYCSYCATVHDVLSSKLALYTSGFSVQGSKTGDAAGVSVTISATLTVSENVRCVALANGATQPTATEVNAGTGASGATAASASSATSATTLSNVDVTIASLTAATHYDVYCATEAGVLGTVVTFYTSGFTVSPSKSADNAGISVGITLTPSLSESVRCVAVPDGAAVPTAAEILAGTGQGGVASSGTHGTVSATALSSLTVTITTLTTATAYDV